MIWLRTAGLRLVLALGLALSLWVFVAYTTNPERQAQFTDRPLAVEGLSPGLVIVDSDSTPRTSLPNVTLNVQGDDRTIGGLNPGDLRAYVDVTERGPGDYNLPISVAPTRSGLAQLRITTTPDSTSVRIEQIITQTAALTVEVTGQVPFSFQQRPAEALTASGQPITSVQVGGPEGRVQQVARVRTEVNINQLTANYNSPRPLEAVTQDGQVVDGVTIFPATVNVRVPIVSSAGVKRVPIVPQVTGSPASGYVVAAVSVTPQFVTLVGNTGALESSQSISTTPFNVGRASGSISQTLELLPPSGTNIQTGEPSRVTVTVEVRPINQPFVVSLPVPVTLTNIPAGTIVSYTPQVIQVQFEGVPGQLATIQGSSVQGTINVSGRGAGTFTVVPTLRLPPGVRVRGDVSRVTVTIRISPSPVPPTATNAPAATATPNTTATAVSPDQPTSVVPPAVPSETPAPPASTSAAVPADQPTPAETPSVSGEQPIVTPTQ